jgi:hypothetical protein
LQKKRIFQQESPLKQSDQQSSSYNNNKVFQSLNEEEEVWKLIQCMDYGEHDPEGSSSLFSISSQSQPPEIKSFLSSH